MDLSINCYCKSGVAFDQCCQQFILEKKSATTAEALMRSRFSAYVVGNFEYILKTYAEKQRSKLSITELAQHSTDTQWVSLEVIKHIPKQDTAQVEFKAYYKVDKKYYVMHELSDFVLVDNQWFYTTGYMLKETGEYKQERNNPCLCASGKKFKKCCGK